jgi:hypothetical protein
MKFKTFICSAILATLFVFLGTSSLEARRHSHSHVHVNVGTSFVQRPAYVVRPVYPQPVVTYAQPVYAYPHERVVVYPSPVYQEVVAVPAAPSFSLFSFGLSLFR